MPYDVAKEDKIISLLFAFGRKPRPASPGREKLHMNCWIFVAFLRVEFRDLCFEVVWKKLVFFSDSFVLLCGLERAKVCW